MIFLGEKVIFFVPEALLEYAAILMLFKKRRKPMIKIEEDIKNNVDDGDTLAGKESVRQTLCNFFTMNFHIPN